MIIAKLWAEQIMNNKRTFSEVPAKLREQVETILIDNGRSDLVV